MSWFNFRVHGAKVVIYESTSFWIGTFCLKLTWSGKEFFISGQSLHHFLQVKEMIWCRNLAGIDD